MNNQYILLNWYLIALNTKELSLIFHHLKKHYVETVRGSVNINEGQGNCTTLMVS